jgi:hypothetical protein
MWSAFDEPPDLAGWLSGSAAGASPDDILAGLRLDQRRRWKTKSPWLVEAYIERLPLPSGMNWQLELAVGEFEARRRVGDPLSVDDLSSRFPDLSDTLRQRLSDAAVGAEFDSTYLSTEGIGYEWMEFCRWLTSEYRGEDESWQCYRDPELLEKDGNGNPRVGRLLVERGGFRMPTSSEWELGAGGGQETPWSFGSDAGLLRDYGWFEENSGNRPHGVCLKRPSLGGLYDVHGNMFEWMHDWYDEIEEGSVVVDPQGAASGQDRVLRGGSWSYGAADCRMANRNTNDPAYRSTYDGFRLALSPSVNPPEAEAEANPQADK